MQFNVQTFLNYFLIVLALTSGLVAGAITSRLVALSLGTSHQRVTMTDAVTTAVQQPQEEDLQIILQRSLFDMASVGSRLESLNLSTTSVSGNGEGESAPSQATSIDLDRYTLLGTVVAGEYSLALIQSGSEVQVYSLDSEVESGITVAQIERKLVVLTSGGRRYELPLLEAQDTASSRVARRSTSATSVAATAPGTAQDSIVELGGGRYRVDRAMVENARANMGALLQSARMIPHLENGQTVGFRLVGMQRGSLLEQLGLKLGDVVMEINRIKLDSPEKALQIFQQVREANNISIGLVRDGQPETFEYSLD